MLAYTGLVLFRFKSLTSKRTFSEVRISTKRPNDQMNRHFVAYKKVGQTNILRNESQNNYSLLRGLNGLG